MQLSLSTYKDDWYFDIGSNIAFNQIIFLVILLFSQVAPLITPFGMLFFTFKYHIDKYNIMYVYPVEYVGEGRLQKRMLFYFYTGIVFSQTIMFYILNNVFNQRYWATCIFIVALQLFFLILKPLLAYLPVESIKVWMAKDYLTQEDEKRLEQHTENKIKKALANIKSKNQINEPLISERATTMISNRLGRVLDEEDDV
jgi:hypothetical protein